MKSFICLIASLFMINASVAFAGPVGIYDVVGTNPGDGSTYTGVVAVKRNGATYVVGWKVGSDEYFGTGIGAASINGSITFGEAAEQDSAITVSYIAGDSFGLALYVEQENGQWKGIWAYGGSDSIGSEIWTPRE